MPNRNAPPLARFRLSYFDGAAWQSIGDSNWRLDALRGSSLFGSTFTLQQLLNQYQGYEMCLAIFGADETGNIQFDPGVFAPADLTANDIEYIQWTNGGRRTPNLAVDTTLRVELFHEKSSNIGVRYRNYGTAQRIPLPPLSEACDTRANAYITMRSLVPSADAPVILSNGGLLWKLYREGSLVARGVVPLSGALPPWIQSDDNGSVSFPLMTMLANCGYVANVSDLGDTDANGFKIDNQSLNLNTYMNLRPSTCAVANDFSDVIYRLGDEGDPPIPESPNVPTPRRREIHYTLTAQTVVLYEYMDPYNPGATLQDLVIDATPATNNFSIYVRSVEEQLRDEAAIREYGE